MRKNRTEMMALALLTVLIALSSMHSAAEELRINASVLVQLDAVQNWGLSNNTHSLLNQSFTEEQVAALINDAEFAIQQLSLQGLPVEKARDLLADARVMFYGRNLDLMMMEAKLINVTDPESAAVMFEHIQESTREKSALEPNYTIAYALAQESLWRKQETLDLRQDLVKLDIAISARNTSDYNLTAALEHRDAAWQSFAIDRFADARNEINASYTALQLAIEHFSFFRKVFDISRQTTVHFIKTYWPLLVPLLLFLSAAAYVGYNEHRIRAARRTIASLNTEREVVLKLIERLQRSKFISHEISDHLYKEKLEFYRSRLLRMQEQSPVERLRLGRYLSRRFWPHTNATMLEREANETDMRVKKFLGTKR